MQLIGLALYVLLFHLVIVRSSRGETKVNGPCDRAIVCRPTKPVHHLTLVQTFLFYIQMSMVFVGSDQEWLSWCGIFDFNFLDIRVRPAPGILAGWFGSHSSVGCCGGRCVSSRAQGSSASCFAPMNPLVSAALPLHLSSFASPCKSWLQTKLFFGVLVPVLCFALVSLGHSSLALITAVC